MIGVSDATVRNWVKAGYLVPMAQRPLTFQEIDVLRLKSQIRAGSIKRLRSRANKASSSILVTPKGYSVSIEATVVVRQITDIACEYKLSTSETLYAAALRVLALSGDLKRCDGASLGDPRIGFTYRRQVVLAELLDWYEALKRGGRDHAAFENIYKAITTDVGDDFLGLLYQSLATVGSRSERGSYYTPTEVVEDGLRASGFTGGSFLDPCCGTGKFLVVASRMFSLDVSQLFGVDNDPLAVRIARLNLLLAHPEYESAPDIQCLDALTEYATGEIFCKTNHTRGNIDFVATNPPWGSLQGSSTSMEMLAPGSHDAFALFLFKSIDILRKGGKLSFLLPESFLNVKAHSAVRAYLVQNSTITRIVKLGRVFNGVSVESSPSRSC